MDSFFHVPDPKPPGWADAWLSSLYAARPARKALQSHAHEITSWEALLREGLTCDALLQCDPRAVCAWVRTADDCGITVIHMCAMPGGDALNAAALLRAWGPRLTPTLVRRLKLDISALEALGLDHSSVCQLDWTPARWRELFGAVPAPGAVAHAPPPVAAPPPRDAEPSYVHHHASRTIGVRVLRL